jgi:hypothetical protein
MNDRDGLKNVVFDDTAISMITISKLREKARGTPTINLLSLKRCLTCTCCENE